MLKVKIFSVIFVLIFGCREKYDQVEEKIVPVITSDSALVEFSFSINKETYLYSIYGEPPQIAIWLENKDSTYYKTAWVTHRAVKNDWVGKVECLVALPYWDFKRRGENKKIMPDAVTTATPKEGHTVRKVRVAPGSRWTFYIEVNA